MNKSTNSNSKAKCSTLFTEGKITITGFPVVFVMALELVFLSFGSKRVCLYGSEVESKPTAFCRCHCHNLTCSVEAVAS